MASNVSATAMILRSEWYSLPGQPIRVAVAVHALVMVANDRGQLVVAEPAHHLGAVNRVTLDDLELRVCEPGRLIEDLRCDTELADIVDQCGGANRVDLPFGETHLLGDSRRVASHAVRMASRISVLGLERRRQLP